MLVVDCINYDVGLQNKSFDNLVQDIITKTTASWNKGADVVVFPEYAWVNAVQYTQPMLSRHELAKAFWNEQFTKLQSALSVPNKTVILGSVPRFAGTELRNTSPIINGGEVLMQDKLALTPWEDEFAGGDKIEVFKIGSLNCAVQICLDIEMPDLAQIFKDYGAIDIIFVPSATETIMGAERIARCASARAVELGCAVITCGLTGEIKSYPFIDSNWGRTAQYLPALTGLENENRVVESRLEQVGYNIHRYEVSPDILRKSKEKVKSTNPALIQVSKKVGLNFQKIIIAA